MRWHGFDWFDTGDEMKCGEGVEWGKSRPLTVLLLLFALLMTRAPRVVEIGRRHISSIIWQERTQSNDSDLSPLWRTT
jgi:hypothetical protein